MITATDTHSWPIGELARRAGLNTSAIRYYERLGLLPEPERVGGKRRYGQPALTRLTIIELAQRAGFTLAETRTLLAGFSPRTPPSKRWQALAHRKLSEVEVLIARANEMKQLLQQGLECDCISLEDCELYLAHGRQDTRSPDAAH